VATLAMPTETELSQLSKNDLIGVVQRAVGRLQAQGSRIKKMAASLKDEAVDIGWGALGYGTAAVAGAGVGYWMGSIQRNILDGKEGYDEESLLVMGFDKDLVAAVAGAVGAYAMSKRKETKEYAPYLRMASMGALASWAGRMGYEYGMAPPEEEGEQPAA
jgi:hypothetical protein